MISLHIYFLSVRILTYQMLTRMWNNFHSLLVGMRTGTVILDVSLAASYEIKLVTQNTLNIHCRNCVP